MNLTVAMHRVAGANLGARLDGERDEMVDRTTTLWKGCETALE